MNVVTVLYGASLGSQAFEPVLKGESAFNLALKGAAAFPGSKKTVFLAQEGKVPPVSGGISVMQRPEWTVSDLLKVLSEETAGFDFAYYAWADTPFLDPVLAGKIAERHTRFAADYSYADGWPYGIGPELISAAAANILYRIAADDGKGPVKRDSLFAVLQKDINSFDIETEISPADLRYHRLSLAADSERNLLLLERFAGAGCSCAEDLERIIKDHPEYLRTLPAFFPIQVSASCPGGAGTLAAGTDIAGANPGAVGSGVNPGGSCAFCPYPRLKNSPYNEKAFLPPADFAEILAKIENFAGDAVIDLSLWGEFSLHPQREELIQSVLDRPALSLIIETSGYGWAGFALEQIAQKAADAQKRLNGLPALSWIVSLGASDLPAKETEALAFVKKLSALFPRENGARNAGLDERVYVETIRTAGAEDAVEQFYRAWKAGFPASNVNPGIQSSAVPELSPPGLIIQKYDSFCGFLPQRQAVDLSPVERRPCWHLMRDFPILIDGTVPLCREDLGGVLEKAGNIFREEPEIIWKRGEALYLSHCRKEYEEPCKICDEYYTFNF